MSPCPSLARPLLRTQKKKMHRHKSSSTTAMGTKIAAASFGLQLRLLHFFCSVAAPKPALALPLAEELETRVELE